MWGCVTTARTAEKSQAWSLGLNPSPESPSLTLQRYHGAQVFEEYSYYDQSETLEARYIYGDEGVDDVKVMMRSESGTLDAYYYYHKNTLGSIVAITDDSGDLAEQYSYDPYGTVYMKDGNGDGLSASAIKNPYLFTGRRYDEEIGKYYYRARQYDPDTGRFMQRDPIGYVDGMNLYEYVRSNPMNFTDPKGKGLWAFCLAGVTLSLVTDALAGETDQCVIFFNALCRCITFLGGYKIAKNALVQFTQLTSLGVANILGCPELSKWICAKLRARYGGPGGGLPPKPPRPPTPEDLMLQWLEENPPRPDPKLEAARILHHSGRRRQSETTPDPYPRGGPPLPRKRGEPTPPKKYGGGNPPPAGGKHHEAAFILHQSDPFGQEDEK